MYQVFTALLEFNLWHVRRLLHQYAETISDTSLTELDDGTIEHETGLSEAEQGIASNLTLCLMMPSQGDKCMVSI